ncbi:response regulator [Cobetia marina]|uniref:response regulator n=1 Tax=Cobetia marina TaxID=28258 RepID=UPI0038571EB2
MNVLVVEDSEDMYDSYKDAAEDKSKDGFKIELHREVNADVAIEKLLSREFDGAIIDLNLDSQNPQAASGNVVLKAIVEQLRFPVCVVSGNLSNLDPDLSNKASAFLKFYNRDVSNDIIFNSLVDIYSTGITQILGGRGQIEKSLTKTFWNHFANNFDVWLGQDEFQERLLLRYTLSHLLEYLDEPNEDHKYYHEAEFYIMPPIKEVIATGDILDKDDEQYIVLSPSCDIVNRSPAGQEPKINSERIVLALLHEVGVETFLREKIIKESSNKKERENILSDIIKGKRDRFLFLPGYSQIKPSVIDLQKIYTFSFEEVRSYHRLATVSGVFLKDIQSKFSAYYGRQGQPDLNKVDLLNRYKDLLADQK